MEDVAQKRVMGLISEGVLSHVAMAQRLKISRQRVDVICHRLEEKGLISGGVFHRKSRRGVLTPAEGGTGSQGQHFHGIRLHGQVFTLKVVNSSPKYESFLKAGQNVNFEGHPLQLSRAEITIHSFPGLEFVAENSLKAYARSVPYWRALFYRVEKHFGPLLMKPGSERIRQVKAHCAEENNELASLLKTREEALKLVGDDGLQWLISDWSKGYPELETVHPLFSINDMMAVKPFFEDLRINCPGMTFSGFKAGLKDALGIGQPIPAAPDWEAPGRPDYIG